MIQPGRKYSASDSYRYGFNGKENDNEVKGEGNQQDYGMRIYDPRVGRFLSVDPLSAEYPELTPYQFGSNRPIDGIDLDGLEWSNAREGANGNFNDYDPFAMKHGRIINRRKAETPQMMKKRFLFVIVYGAAVIAPASVELIASIPVTATISATNVVIWVSNPINQLAAASVTGFAFELLNPDPNGTPGVDIPGTGDEFARAVKWLFKTKAGKQVEFVAEQGAKFANQSEFNWVGKLLNEGNNVTLLKESTEEGVYSADLLVNGIRTEIKEISNMTSDKLGERVKETFEKAIKQAGSGGNIIIDVTKQQGATKELLENTIIRLKGKAKDSYNYRVVGQGFEITGTVEKKKS